MDSQTSDINEETEEKKQSKADTIGDRMKSYETKFTSAKLDPTIPFIIRLDGHKFSSYTRPFKKPFDERSTLQSISDVPLVSTVMVATTMDLLNAFNPTTAFTCSDEITLLFPAMSGVNTEPSEENNDEKHDSEEIKEELTVRFQFKDILIIVYLYYTEIDKRLFAPLLKLVETLPAYAHQQIKQGFQQRCMSRSHFPLTKFVEEEKR